jgi:hypothetical protein
MKNDMTSSYRSWLFSGLCCFTECIFGIWTITERHPCTQLILHTLFLTVFKKFTLTLVLSRCCSSVSVAQTRTFYFPGDFRKPAAWTLSVVLEFSFPHREVLKRASSGWCKWAMWEWPFGGQNTVFTNKIPGSFFVLSSQQKRINKIEVVTLRKLYRSGKPDGNLFVCFSIFRILLYRTVENIVFPWKCCLYTFEQRL